MKIPKTFKLGGVTWTVEHVDLAAGDLQGRCRSEKATIQLEKTQAQNTIGQVFCHELVHAILFAMGKHVEPHDEVFVDGFATFLHQYLEQHGK